MTPSCRAPSRPKLPNTRNRAMAQSRPEYVKARAGWRTRSRTRESTGSARLKRASQSRRAAPSAKRVRRFPRNGSPARAAPRRRRALRSATSRVLDPAILRVWIHTARCRTPSPWQQRVQGEDRRAGAHDQQRAGEPDGDRYQPCPVESLVEHRHRERGDEERQHECDRRGIGERQHRQRRK